MENNYHCPFCGRYTRDEWVVQGKGKHSTKQWFHSSCFVENIKNKTYWDFKLYSRRL